MSTENGLTRILQIRRNNKNEKISPHQFGNSLTLHCELKESS